MKRDLSESDFAGLELQATRFSEMYSPVGDIADDGDIFVALRWLCICMVFVGMAAASAVWGLS